MLKLTIAIMTALSIAGCAYHGAVRVTCDGDLRPVNVAIESHEPPVSVVPQDPAGHNAAEPQP